MISELEMSVIGGILLSDESGLNKAFSILTPECFSDERLSNVYGNLRKQYQKTGEVSIPGAVDGIADDEVPAFLVQCMDFVAIGSGLPYHTELLFDKYRKRLLAEGAARLTEGTAFDVPLETLLAELYQMQEVQAKLDEVQTGGSSLSLLDSIVEYLNSLYRPEAAPVKTGIGQLDRILGGFYRKRVYALSGRSGMGKSDFSVFIATKLAARGAKVLYLSMEMPRAEIMERIASSISVIDSAILNDPERRTAEQTAAVCKCLERIKSIPLTLDEQQNISAGDIVRKIKSHRPDVVFIDHIQLMEQNPYKKYWENAFENSKSLKRIAMQENVAVIELVQQNADVERRRDKTSTLADLKGSDGIGNDADTVMFISAQKGEEPLCGNQAFEARLEIVKNRQGKTGTVPLRWQPQYHRYMQVEVRREEA